MFVRSPGSTSPPPCTLVSGDKTPMQFRPVTLPCRLARGASGRTRVTLCTWLSPAPSVKLAMHDNGKVVGSGEQPKGGEIEVISTPSSRPSPSTPIASPMRTGPENGVWPPLLMVIWNEQGCPGWHSASPVFLTLIVDVPPPLAQAWPIG